MVKDLRQKKKKEKKKSKHKTCGRVGVGLPVGMGVGLPMCDKRHSDVYDSFFLIINIFFSRITIS